MKRDFSTFCPPQTMPLLMAFYDFRNNQKSVWSDVFWYVKVGIFWKWIQYTIHCDKTNVKKFSPIEKKARQKMPSFFSRAQTYHSFSFNLQLLYFLSKTVCGILRFDLVSFLLKFIFFFNKMHETFDSKNVIIPFNIKIMGLLYVTGLQNKYCVVNSLNSF